MIKTIGEITIDMSDFLKGIQVATEEIQKALDTGEISIPADAIIKK